MVRKLGIGVLAAVVHFGVHGYLKHEWYVAGRNDGINVMEAAVAECTLADARLGVCFIPCGTDSDCVAKNGREEY